MVTGARRQPGVPSAWPRRGPATSAPEPQGPGDDLEHSRSHLVGADPQDLDDRRAFGLGGTQDAKEDVLGHRCSCDQARSASRSDISKDFLRLLTEGHLGRALPGLGGDHAGHPLPDLVQSYPELA